MFFLGFLIVVTVVGISQIAASFSPLSFESVKERVTDNVVTRFLAGGNPFEVCSKESSQVTTSCTVGLRRVTVG